MAEIKRENKNKGQGNCLRPHLKLYAQRKAQNGFAHSPDNYMQNELEASFIYEDTPRSGKGNRRCEERHGIGFSNGQARVRRCWIWKNRNSDTCRI